MYEYIILNNVVIYLYTFISIAFSRFEVEFQGYIFLDAITTERPST